MRISVTTQPISNNGIPRFGRFDPKTRVYIHPKNESILENIMNRRSRPRDQYKQVLLEGLTMIDVDLSRITYRWSQKAGCSCGCSPGFIIDGYDPNIGGKNVWIEVEAD